MSSSGSAWGLPTISKGFPFPDKFSKSPSRCECCMRCSTTFIKSASDLQYHMTKPSTNSQERKAKKKLASSRTKQTPDTWTKLCSKSKNTGPVPFITYQRNHVNTSFKHGQYSSESNTIQTKCTPLIWAFLFIILVTIPQKKSGKKTKNSGTCPKLNTNSQKPRQALLAGISSKSGNKLKIRIRPNPTVLTSAWRRAKNRTPVPDEVMATTKLRGQSQLMEPLKHYSNPLCHILGCGSRFLLRLIIIAEL